jgi:anti-sigma factor RsiW
MRLNMTHDEALRLADAYVDGELDMASALAFDEHAAACPDCAARLLGRTALIHSVRRADLSYRCPDVLRRRIERDVRARATTTRSVLTSPLLPAALAAGLALAIGGFYVGDGRARAGVVAAEFASAHARALLVGHEVDVLSSDHHVVKPWFAGRLAFSPPAPELAGVGYQLVGGRVDLVAGRRVAALVYRHGAHAATVFVWPRDSAPKGGVRELAIDGYRVLRGAAGDLDCVFVTDMSPDEATRFRAAWLADADH